MGFNTVAFLLNDLHHETEKSPKALTFAITHPVSANLKDTEYGPKDIDVWRRQTQSVAADAGEPGLHFQAVEAYTFHADEQKFIFAGRNTIEFLKVLKFGKTKSGKKTVTLELPDWWGK